MAIIPTRAKRFGLRFETSAAKTFGLERMRLELYGIPPTFLEHELAMPQVGGKRFQFDQQSTSTCVSNAFCAGIVLAEARAGLPFDEPSRLFPYWNSRREHNQQWYDGGTYLRTCGIALRKFGTPSERFWKWGQFSGRVNRRPNWTADRKAYPRRDGKYVRIYETGGERTKAIQQAILNGHDVAFGTRLGVSFLDSNGPALIDKPSSTEKIAGNHAMLIIGWQHFEVQLGGGRYERRLYFRVLNSWGPRWRDGGLCWMSAKYLEWTYTQDLHIIYGWKRLTQEAA